MQVGERRLPLCGHEPPAFEIKDMEESKGESAYEQQFDTMPEWTPVAIRRILSNEIYTGVIIQGKDKKLSYKLPVRKKLPKDEWIRVEGAVTPIITKDVFEKVQKIDLRKKYH